MSETGVLLRYRTNRSKPKRARGLQAQYHEEGRCREKKVGRTSSKSTGSPISALGAPSLRCPTGRGAEFRTTAPHEYQEWMLVRYPSTNGDGVRGRDRDRTRPSRRWWARHGGSRARLALLATRMEHVRIDPLRSHGYVPHINSFSSSCGDPAALGRPDTWRRVGSSDGSRG